MAKVFGFFVAQSLHSSLPWGLFMALGTNTSLGYQVWNNKKMDSCNAANSESLCV